MNVISNMYHHENVRPAVRKLRLLCFPYAGGSVALYHTWHHDLPAAVQVCPIEFPGRGSRIGEPPLKELGLLVQSLLDLVLPHLDGPFALFGHSMGALVSFELARALKKIGKQPLHIFVSGRRAPQIPPTERRTFDLPHHQFVDSLRKLNGTPQELFQHSELMEIMIPILRADFEACQTYSYLDGPPLNSPITVLAGMQDEEAKTEYIEGWRRQTTSRFTSRVFPGDHFFLRSAKSLVLRALSSDLTGS